jgi:hypothetical protein
VRRHEIDVVSLAAGLLFLGVAGVHMVAGATNTDLNLRWMVPLVLVLLGVVGMLGAVRGRREPNDMPATVAEPLSTTVAEPLSTTVAEPLSTVPGEPESDSVAEPVSASAAEPEVAEEVDESSAKQ